MASLWAAPPRQKRRAEKVQTPRAEKDRTPRAEKAAGAKPACESLDLSISSGDAVDGCEILRHFEAMVETITFVGIYKGIIRNRGLKGGGGFRHISSIHSIPKSTTHTFGVLQMRKTRHGECQATVLCTESIT